MLSPTRPYFDRRTPEWQGADLTGVVELGGGRRLWLFGDTWLGSVDREGRPGPATRLVASSAFLQEAGCFRRLGPPDEAFLPAPEDGGWYWPSNGWVEGGLVIVVASHVVATQEGPFGFATVGQRLVLLDPERLLPTGVVVLPLAVGAPGVLWGDAAVASDGFWHVFGHEGGAIHLARVAVGATLTGPWEVWDGGGFSDRLETSAPVLEPGTIETRPSVSARPGGLLMVAKVDTMLTDGVHGWFATQATGPWQELGLVVPSTPVGPTEISYMATVVDDPMAGVLVVYNVLDLDVAHADLHAYGPRVVGMALDGW